MVEPQTLIFSSLSSIPSIVTLIFFYFYNKKTNKLENRIQTLESSFLILNNSSSCLKHDISDFKHDISAISKLVDKNNKEISDMICDFTKETSEKSEEKVKKIEEIEETLAKKFKELKSAFILNSEKMDQIQEILRDHEKSIRDISDKLDSDILEEKWVLGSVG